MNRSALLEKAASWAPAFFLVLAAALGGLRLAPAWLAFAAVFLAWTALRPRQLSGGGLKAPVLFFCWLLAAAVFSPEPAVSLPAFCRAALPGLFFFAALSGREGEKNWLPAVYALGAAAALTFLFQRLSGGWVTGFIGNNPNYTAAFCAAAFGPAVLALSGAAGARRAAPWALLALLLAAGLYASGSRGAALAAFLAAGAGLAAERRWVWLGGLLAAALAAAAALSPESLNSLLKLHDPRAFERPRLWAAALQAAAASPLLGWGPGLFERTFELFKFPYFDGLAYYAHSTLHAHSEPLNLAAEAGFPAAVLFLAAAVSALAAGWRERLPLKLCALAVLLQGSLDMVFYSGAVGLLFWGALGLSVPAPEADPAPRPALPVLAALLLLGLAAVPANKFFRGAADYRAAAGAEARAGSNPELALALARSGAFSNPASPFPAADEGAALAAAGDFTGAAAAFERALALEPAFAAARFGLARVRAAAGLRAEACAQAQALLARPAPEKFRNDYQRLLVALDPGAAESFRKEICRKKTTGGATASPSRKPSTATR